MTVKGPTASNSSLDSLSSTSTSSTSSFVAMGRPPSTNATHSQPSSYSYEDDDEEDTEDERRDPMEHTKEDIVDGHRMEHNNRNNDQDNHQNHQHSRTSSSPDQFASQDAFAKFHKMDQKLQQQQQQQAYQRQRSLSPPGPAPVYKNQIHVQNSPLIPVSTSVGNHRPKDRTRTVEVDGESGSAPENINFGSPRKHSSNKDRDQRDGNQSSPKKDRDRAVMGSVENNNTKQGDSDWRRRKAREGSPPSPHKGGLGGNHISGSHHTNGVDHSVLTPIFNEVKSIFLHEIVVFRAEWI